jgi:N-acyl-D-aspartate/D-glutamate deacylase
MVLDGLDHWSDLFKLPLPQRIEAFSDPSVRPALAEAFGKMRGLLSLWSDLSAWSVAEVHREENKMFVGKTIGDVARAQGKEPIDAFLDLALSEELKTSFLGPPIGADDDSWRIRAESWHDDRTIIGGSDAGAHLDMLDTFAFSSIVLGEGVRRRRLMSLEKAVHQITGLPARHLGLVDRGELRPGASADLVVFDPETVDVGPVHTRTDLPAGAPRLYAEAVGVDYVLVNGVEIVGHGEYTGAIGGKILRSGRDTRTVSIH